MSRGGCSETVAGRLHKQFWSQLFDLLFANTLSAKNSSIVGCLKMCTSNHFNDLAKEVGTIYKANHIKS